MDFMIWEPYMLASVGQPSLHGNFGLREHSGEIAGYA